LNLRRTKGILGGKRKKGREINSGAIVRFHFFHQRCSRRRRRGSTGKRGRGRKKGKKRFEKGVAPMPGVKVACCGDSTRPSPYTDKRHARGGKRKGKRGKKEGK